MATEKVNRPLHDDSLLSTGEVAAVLMVSPEKVIRWRKAGMGPYFSRLGRIYLYRLSDVQNWSDENR